MFQVSRWVEKLFFPKDNSLAMVRERLHFENMKSLTDKPLDVVRYLYMRLNIIDAKAGYLLRINALTAGVIGILISVSTREGAAEVLQKFDKVELSLLGAVLILMFLAFLLCFAISELEYDHVTEPSGWINQVRVSRHSPFKYSDMLSNPSTRRFTPLYSFDDVMEIVNLVDPVPHSMKAYEDLFFKITIARVRMLYWARLFVLWAWICYTAFIALVIWSGFQIQPQKSSPQQEGAMSWNAVLYGPV